MIGDWWTPLLIRECLYGVERFDEFQKTLHIGRNILTRRLARLVEQGVLEKHPYQERPPRHAYRLTEKGYEAAKMLFAMVPFGEKWLFGVGEEPIHLFDRHSDQRVSPVLVDRNTGEEIDARNLYAGPGPGFPSSEALRRRRFREYFRRVGGGSREPTTANKP